MPPATCVLVISEDTFSNRAKYFVGKPLLHDFQVLEFAADAMLSE